MGTNPIPLSTTSLIQLRMFSNHHLCSIFKFLDQALDGIKLDSINTVQRILSGKNHISEDLLSGKNAAANIGLGSTLESRDASLFVNPQDHVLLGGFEALHIVAVHMLVHIDQSVVTLADVHHGAWLVEVCGNEEDGDDGGGVLHVGIVRYFVVTADYGVQFISYSCYRSSPSRPGQLSGFRGAES